MNTSERIPTMKEIFARYEESLRTSGNGKLKPGQKRAVASYKSWSKQRKAKKMGFAVELEYEPMPRFTENLALLPCVAQPEAYNIFVKLTIYNETHEERYHKKVVSHYIPLQALDELFQLANVVKEDKLWEYFLARETGGREDLSEERYALKKQLFQDRIQGMYNNCCFEFDPNEQKPKMFSMLSIDHKHNNTKGKISKFPWTVYCMQMPYVVNVGLDDEDEDAIADSAFEKKEMVWDSNQLTETFIYVSSDQLVDAAQRIYQEICCWFDELAGKNA